MLTNNPSQRLTYLEEPLVYDWCDALNASTEVNSIASEAACHRQKLEKLRRDFLSSTAFTKTEDSLLTSTPVTNCQQAVLTQPILLDTLLTPDAWSSNCPSETLSNSNTPICDQQLHAFQFETVDDQVMHPTRLSDVIIDCGHSPTISESLTIDRSGSEDHASLFVRRPVSVVFSDRDLCLSPAGHYSLQVNELVVASPINSPALNTRGLPFDACSSSGPLATSHVDGAPHFICTGAAHSCPCGRTKYVNSACARTALFGVTITELERSPEYKVQPTVTLLTEQRAHCTNHVQTNKVCANSFANWSYQNRASVTADDNRSSPTLVSNFNLPPYVRLTYRNESAQLTGTTPVQAKMNEQDPWYRSKSGYLPRRTGIRQSVGRPTELDYSSTAQGSSNRVFSSAQAAEQIATQYVTPSVVSECIYDSEGANRCHTDLNKSPDVLRRKQSMDANLSKMDRTLKDFTSHLSQIDSTLGRMKGFGSLSQYLDSFSNFVGEGCESGQSSSRSPSSNRQDSTQESVSSSHSGQSFDCNPIAYETSPKPDDPKHPFALSSSLGASLTTLSSSVWSSLSPSTKLNGYRNTPVTTCATRYFDFSSNGKPTVAYPGKHTSSSKANPTAFRDVPDSSCSSDSVSVVSVEKPIFRRSVKPRPPVDRSLANASKSDHRNANVRQSQSGGLFKTSTHMRQSSSMLRPDDDRSEEDEQPGKSDLSEDRKQSPTGSLLQIAESLAALTNRREIARPRGSFASLQSYPKRHHGLEYTFSNHSLNEPYGWRPVHERYAMPSHSGSACSMVSTRSLQFIQWPCDVQVEERLPSMRPKPRPIPPLHPKSAILPHTDVLKRVDMRAIEVTATNYVSFTELVQALITELTDDVQVMRALFSWIVANDLRFKDFDPAAPPDSLIDGSSSKVDPDLPEAQRLHVPRVAATTGQSAHHRQLHISSPELHVPTRRLEHRALPSTPDLSVNQSTISLSDNKRTNFYPSSHSSGSEQSHYDRSSSSDTQESVHALTEHLSHLLRTGKERKARMVIGDLLSSSTSRSKLRGVIASLSSECCLTGSAWPCDVQVEERLPSMRPKPRPIPPLHPKSAILPHTDVLKRVDMRAIEVNTALCRAWSRFAGLHSYIIFGYSKDTGYRPGMPVKSNRLFCSSWLAVHVGGGWRFVNVDWAMRASRQNEILLNSIFTGINPTSDLVDLNSSNGKPTIKEADQRFCDEFYFLTDPEQHIFEHFPEHKLWQLLPKPIGMDRFVRLPLLKSAFFNANLSLKKNYGDCLVTSNGQVTLKLLMPHFVGISCSLENSADHSILRGLCLVEVLAETDEVRIQVAPSQPGKYYLHCFVAPDWRQEHDRELACAFQIHCSEHNYSRLIVMGRLPEVGFLGPTPAARTLGVFMHTTNRNGRSFLVHTSADPLRIPFVVAPGLKICHQLKSFDRPGNQMVDCDSYALLQMRPRKLTNTLRSTHNGPNAYYHVRMPVEGFYYLTVYATPNTDVEADHLECVYRVLIDVRKTPAPSTVAAFPRQTFWWVQCRLHEPLSQRLRVNQVYTFRLDAPVCDSVAVVINETDWHFLTTQNNQLGTWIGKINVGEFLGQLSVFGRFWKTVDEFHPSADLSDEESEAYVKLLDYVVVE
ncbi:hypothetical protein AHF37_04174 [Paragonimus kellicotti]|nr:hypothetical protein AHF37_04174 [Paragonimus kellicotti]